MCDAKGNYMQQENFIELYLINKSKNSLSNGCVRKFGIPVSKFRNDTGPFFNCCNHYSENSSLGQTHAMPGPVDQQDHNLITVRITTLESKVTETIVPR